MTIYTKITELEERTEKLEKRLEFGTPSREPNAKYSDYYCVEFKYLARSRIHDESLWRVIFKGDLPTGNSEIKRINTWKDKNGVPEYMELSFYRDAEEGDDAELDKTIRLANDQEDVKDLEVSTVCQVLETLVRDLCAGTADLVSFNQELGMDVMRDGAGTVHASPTGVQTLHITYRTP